jgi:hypothetical protein
MKLYDLHVRGKRDEWEFEILADPRHVDDWRADGLRVDEIVNTVPDWWILPVRWWCILQDLYKQNGL